MNYASHIASALQKEIERLPDRFYDSFDYTSTGRNLTHPLTLGVLAKILWQIEGVNFVAVDFRLNQARIKFQPDLAALSSINTLKPLLFLDYESPNSCDTRIPKKDIIPYTEWCKVYGSRVPYIIITSLPSKPTSDWQLRYASKGKDNAKYKDRKKQLFENPFEFWYADYRAVLTGHDLDMISLVNIDGKKVEIKGLYDKV